VALRAGRDTLLRDRSLLALLAAIADHSYDESGTASTRTATPTTGPTASSTPRSGCPWTPSYRSESPTGLHETGNTTSQTRQALQGPRCSLSH